MATVDSQNFKVSVKDLVWFAMALCGIVANYYAITNSITELKLGQDKTNTVIMMRLDRIEPVLDKNTLDIRDIQLQQRSSQRFVPNTDKPL